MIIGEPLQAPGAGTLYHIPWYPRQGYGAVFAGEQITVSATRTLVIGSSTIQQSRSES